MTLEGGLVHELTRPRCGRRQMPLRAVGRSQLSACGRWVCDPSRRSAVTVFGGQPAASECDPVAWSLLEMGVSKAISWLSSGDFSAS
jgi:hypothetical protein